RTGVDRGVRHQHAFFFQAEDGIRDFHVTGVQTCALPIFNRAPADLASPKSISLMSPPLATKMFSGLMSRWTMPASWTASSAEHRSEERRVGKGRRARGAARSR